MNRKKLGATIAVVSTVLFAFGIYRIHLDFGNENLADEVRLELLIDDRLGGESGSSEGRHLRMLRSSGDTDLLSMVAVLEATTPIRPSPDTKLLSTLLSLSGSDSLRGGFSWKSVSASRYSSLKYWALRRSGALRAAESSGIAPTEWKSLGRELMGRELPFRAVDAFEAAIRATRDPNAGDPELQGWLGSAMAKRALYTESSLEKIRLVKEGVRVLDKSVYEHPENGILRYIRANTYSALPPVFKKEPMLQDDVSFLLDRLASGRTVEAWTDSGTVGARPLDTAQVRTILSRSRDRLSSSPQLQRRVDSVRAALGGTP